MVRGPINGSSNDKNDRNKEKLKQEVRNERRSLQDEGHTILF
jgi:hypothetical protein